MSMSWHTLPAELHLAVIDRLPPAAVRALSSTSRAARHLCLPAIFAAVSLPSPSALAAFVAHVPPDYAQYVRSLTVAPGPTGGSALLALLALCTRLHTLTLALPSLVPHIAVSAFARLVHVHTLHITSPATEDVAPLSERLVVALAASLPALAHLSVSRVTRSAIHVDPCDVPYNVPIVTNDGDVPPHPLFGTNLALPNLLRLPLRTLEIRDTWLGCDTTLALDGPVSSSLQKLVLTGSMYATSALSESQACIAWLDGCPSLQSFELGTALASPPEPVQSPSRPRVPHVHIDASRLLPDDLSSTLAALEPYRIESISIAYRQVPNPHVKSSPKDEFARQCALDDLEDWRAAIDHFVRTRPKEWDTLGRVDVSLASDIHASWVL